MKSLFPEYFPLTDKEFDDIWKNSYFVFDTNVLLRLYRYRENTVEEIINIFRTIEKRLWIPYQVAWEYNRRRLTKIREAEKSYNDLILDFKVGQENAARKLKDLKEFGIHPKIELEKGINELLNEIEKRTNQIRTDYNNNPTAAHYAHVHDRLGDIFQDRIGPEPSENEIKLSIEEGEKRFALKFPPGFKDVDDKRKKNASEREVFGDYIIWKSILDFAADKKSSVIFVTEDVKEDWWLREDGKTIGPLPALRKEFINRTDKQVQFYRVQSFLEQAKLRLNVKVSQDSVEDVRSNEYNDSMTAFPKWLESIAHSVDVSRLSDETLRDMIERGGSVKDFNNNEKAILDKNILLSRAKNRIELNAARKNYREAREAFEIANEEFSMSKGDAKNNPNIDYVKIEIARQKLRSAKMNLNNTKFYLNDIREKMLEINETIKKPNIFD